MNKIISSDVTTESVKTHHKRQLCSARPDGSEVKAMRSWGPGPAQGCDVRRGR